MQILNKKSFAGLVAAGLTIACVGFASWGSHKSSERKTNVTFISTAKFNNGDTLPAGTYQMEVAENSPRTYGDVHQPWERQSGRHREGQSCV